MLIEVKSAKQEEAQPPSGARRFAFTTGERLTRLPAYFALAAVALAAYLRSIFGVEAARHTEAQLQGDGPPAAPTPDHIRLAEVSSARTNNPAPEEPATEPDEDEVPMTGLQGYPWPGDFWISDYPDPAIVTPIPFEPTPLPVLPRPLQWLPSNDNLPMGIDIGGGSAGGSDAGPPGGGSVPEDEGDPELPDDNDDDDDDDGGEGERANRAPSVSGPVRLNDVFAGQVVLIGLSQLLFGATDADGDRLSVTGLTVDGAHASRTTGGWLIETRHGMLGPVTFTYSITDGEALIDQVAKLDIVRKRTELTDAADLFAATPYDDDIDAKDGDDIVDALAGNDHVEGGAGDDHIVGGDGDDVLVGGTGKDVIFGGAGDDIIHGGEGDDRLFGDGGDDTVFADAGNDYVEGGEGDDIVYGGLGDDRILGDGGNDVLLGEIGADHIDGGAGADRLVGGDGDDTLAGGDGDDVLDAGPGNDALTGGNGDDHLLAGLGDDVIDGGDGHDELDYSGTEGDLLIDLATGESDGGDAGFDRFTNIEQVTGGAGDDMFVVAGKASIISGGRGRDTFVFEVSEDGAQLEEEIVHKILDFVVGDRVRVREYDLDRDARNAQRDLFESVYGDDDDDWLRSDVPIVVSHERIDEEDWTVIKADIDRDLDFDVAINIQGTLLPPTDTLS